MMIPELHLRKLLTENRKQLDAIKKATNYDSTRKLIELYDEHGGGASTPSPSPQRPGSSNPVTPIRQQQQQGSGSKQDTPAPAPAPAQVQRGTPRAPGHLAGVAGTPAQGRESLPDQACSAAACTELRAAGEPGTPMQLPEGMTPEQAAALHFQMQAIQPVLPTPEKKWYDRIVDSILGDDPCEPCPHKLLLRKSVMIGHCAESLRSTSTAVKVCARMRRMLQT